ncbi:MAG: radical SAM protein [Clostridia bacterium]|nr:radical SAM protein [Clostridia bacterium]
MHVPNLKRLEIDITLLCNLNCINCDRIISVVPSNSSQNMSVDQIKKFIEQSVSNNYEWEGITVLGGEPTIHPDFKEIISLLADYKSLHNHSMRLAIVTNGYGDNNRKVLEWLEYKHPYVIIDNGKKTSKYQPHFINVCNAPVDILEDGKSQKYRGCWLTETVGIALTYSGFYPCSVGSSIDRVFKYDIGIKDIKDLGILKLQEMYDVLCSKCGHYCIKQSSKSGSKMTVSTTHEQISQEFEYRINNFKNEDIDDSTSPVWKEAIKKYYSDTRDLTRY